MPKEGKGLREAIDRHVHPLFDRGLAEAVAGGAGLRDGAVSAFYGTATQRSLFEAGSITKTLTATVLADMVLKGELGLATPLSSILPGPFGDEVVASITLEQLATHTSGLPRLPPDLLALAEAHGSVDDPYRPYTRDHLFAAVQNASCETEPGTTHAYSNYGFGLLGEALAEVAGRPFTALVRERVLEPLGMTSSWLEPVPPTESSRLVRGRRSDGRPASHWTFDAMAGCGALVCDLSDLMRYGRAVVGLGPEQLAAAIRLCLEPRFEIGPGRWVGLAWRLDQRASRTIVWHNGGTYGASSMLGADIGASASAAILLSAQRLATPTPVIALLGELAGAPA